MTTVAPMAEYPGTVLAVLVPLWLFWLPVVALTNPGERRHAVWGFMQQSAIWIAAAVLVVFIWP
jgi:hypothetical protein